MNISSPAMYTEKEALSKRYKYAACIILILIIITYSLFILKKDALHVDEVLSFVISTYNSYGFEKNFNEGIIYTSSTLKNDMFGYDNSIHDILDDIISLRKNNRDSPHTNFYYSLLRVSFIGSHFSGIDTIMLRAGILNICISIITFIFLYRLSLIIFTTDIARITCLILAFFSPAAISTVLFYRPYQLQTLFFIISIFLFYTITNKINNTIRPTIKNNIYIIIFYSFIISLIILTGYFSLLYIFIFFISLIFIAYTKDTAWLKTIMLISILTIIFILIIYPRFFLGLTSYRASESPLKTISFTPIENIQQSLYYLYKLITRNFLCIPGFLSIILIYVLYKLKSFSLFWITIFAAAVFFSCAALIMAPYKTLRYIMPIFPVYALIIAKICDMKGKRGVVSCMIVLAFFISTLLSTPVENYRNQTSYLPQNGTIIVAEKNTWKLSSLVPFLEGEYSFKNSCPKVSWYSSNADKKIFFIDEQCLTENMKNLLSLEGRQGYYAIARLKDSSVE